MAQATRSGRPHDGFPSGHGHHLSGADLLGHARHLRSRHHAAAIAAIAVLVVASIQLFPAREVTILSDGEARDVLASFDTSSTSLAVADVSLDDGDELVVGGQGGHISIRVDRAVPIRAFADGITVELNTQAATVQGALAAAGITLHEGDRVFADGNISSRLLPLTAIRPARWEGSSLAASLAELPDSPIELAVVRARPVLVYLDSAPVEISSAAPDVVGVLRDMGLEVREGDLVEPALDTPVTGGMVIRLAKAQRVLVTVDGVQQTLYTQAGTVAEVLGILGIELGPDDTVSLSLDETVTAGTEVVIARTRTEVIEGDVSIPAGIVYETDASLAPGAVKVIPGRDGRLRVRQEVTYKNGVEVGRVPLNQDVVLEAPIPSRHIVGAAPSPSGGLPTLDAPDYSGPYRMTLNVKATWYNASHGGRPATDPNYGRTATGVYVDYGICAVDPTIIALGTRMYIPGYGSCVAADTGGGVKGNMVDLGFPESAGANPWGTKYLDIYILD